MLFGYALDGGDVHVVDVINGEKIPDEIIKALDNPRIIATESQSDSRFNIL